MPWKDVDKTTPIAGATTLTRADLDEDLQTRMLAAMDLQNRLLAHLTGEDLTENTLAHEVLTDG